jgi:hypothetical protein
MNPIRPIVSSYRKISFPTFDHNVSHR